MTEQVPSNNPETVRRSQAAKMAEQALSTIGTDPLHSEKMKIWEDDELSSWEKLHQIKDLAGPNPDQVPDAADETPTITPDGAPEEALTDDSDTERNQEAEAVEAFIKIVDQKISGSPEPNPVDSAPTTESEPTSPDSEPVPTANPEKHKTIRERIRARGERKKAEKAERKAHKKDIRDKAAQDKLTEKVLDYSNDIKDGRIRTGRVGTLLRKLLYKNGDPRYGTRLGYSSEIEAIEAQERNDIQEAAAALKRKASPDASSGNDPEAQIIPYPTTSHNREKSRGSDAYNNALDRVVAGINKRGGNITTEQVDQVKADAKLGQNEKKAA